MDTSRQGLEVKTASKGKRQRRSIAEKRQIVEETLVEGASVARIARTHGVNANQVFYSLIGSAQLNGLDPETYLSNVVARLADHPINRIQELLPWKLSA